MEPESFCEQHSKRLHESSNECENSSKRTRTEDKL